MDSGLVGFEDTGGFTAQMEKRINDIRVPTLVLVGERHGRRFHRIADYLASHIAVARKMTVPSAAHLAPLENPDAFNDILLDFLGGAVGKALA